MHSAPVCLIFFFFNDTATTEIYTLSLHDALPISYIPEAGWERVAIAALALVACVALVRGVRLGAPPSGAVGLALAVAGVLPLEGGGDPIPHSPALHHPPPAGARPPDPAPGGTVVGAARPPLWHW